MRGSTPAGVESPEFLRVHILNAGPRLMTVVRRRLAVRLRSRWSLARSALMTGHSTCMYSVVPVCVVRQQLWLANSSWRPARSPDNILFGDASHCSLMTDCIGYTYFSYRYHFYSSLRMYGAILS